MPSPAISRANRRYTSSFRCRAVPLSWRNLSRPPEKTLAGQWEMLLMEAARVKDEKAAEGKTDEDHDGRTGAKHNIFTA